MRYYQIASRQQQKAIEASHVARRLLDLIVASAALIVFAPIMSLIALAILLESGRPVLFSQLRVGQHGRPFRMFKFRKFHTHCSTDDCPLTLERDARMTVLGHGLRATKLDELPQFWNVVRGDMSIVGPRPETFAFADCFAGGLERILRYKPGILGPSQVIFRNESALFPPDTDPCVFYRTVQFPAKARIDLEYYQRRTLLRDVGWMVRGALAILRLSQAPIAALPPVRGGPEGLGAILCEPRPAAVGGQPRSSGEE
jgi:lipopolysaccharide/colanic/teichoic acid biosynthesis glycosyltransferase